MTPAKTAIGTRTHAVQRNKWHFNLDCTQICLICKLVLLSGIQTNSNNISKCAWKSDWIDFTSFATICHFDNFRIATLNISTLLTYIILFDNLIWMNDSKQAAAFFPNTRVLLAFFSHAAFPVIMILVSVASGHFNRTHKPKIQKTIPQWLFIISSRYFITLLNPRLINSLLSCQPPRKWVMITLLWRVIRKNL